MTSISRQQAIALIPKVIDGEVTPQEHRRFFTYLRTDEEVRREFESHQKLKIAICCRYSRVKAPEQLRKRIMTLLADNNSSDRENQPG